jgi:hypothetical protein
MLAASLVAPAAALTGTSVVAANTAINATTTYTVTVTLGAQLLTGATITTTFPTGATGLDTATATIASSGGLAFSPYAASAIAVTHTASTQNLVATITAPLQVGVGAIVQLVFTGIINPATVGTYPVMLMTSAETTAITVGSVTTTVPVITPLPGVATVWNTAGIEVFQTNLFDAAVGMLTTYPGATIKLTAGTYYTAASSAVSCTIQGTDASAANVIIKAAAPWTLSGATVVIDKVTIDASNTTPGPLTLSASTAGTISNSILQGGVVTLGGLANTLTNDTVTVLDGAQGVLANTATTITNCTFSVAGAGMGISNALTGIVTVSGCTFTGATATTSTLTGWGIDLNVGATNVIGTSKFSGLTEAMDVTSPAAVSFNGNTVDKCGVATTGPDAIMVHSTAAPGVQVFNNKITNSLENIMTVTTNDSMVWVMGNQFSGNVGNVVNNTH